MPRFYRLLVFLLPLAGMLATSTASGVEEDLLEAAHNSITAAELQRHIEVLADDTFEGRAAGSRGGHAAGGYLRSIFDDHQLLGGAEDNGYYQVFGEGNRNLLGILPGSDEKLRHEFIVICAHYDHVGYGTARNSYGPTGYIHNGADDNASGTAAVLELIDALVYHAPALRRSILFALWDGEENGLLGSKHWTAAPTIELNRLSLVINMDMVGRFREEVGCEINGTRSAVGLRQSVARQNVGIDLPLNFTWETKSNSDQYSFYERDVPVLLFHTGLHDQYHRPSDDTELINKDGLQRVVRLILNVAITTANQEERLDFRQASQNETESTQLRYEAPVPAPTRRMGFSWGSRTADPGLAIIDVTRGSPAEQAGMRRGDRLLRFAGVETNTTEDFRSIGPNVGGAIELTLLRGSEEMTRVMQLPPPVRLGLLWRESEAEPGIVTIVQVQPDSAADDADMNVGDRIYEIGSERFSDSDDLMQRIGQREGLVELLVERQGRFRSVMVDLPPLVDEQRISE